jgi:hypothetical protein
MPGCSSAASVRASARSRSASARGRPARHLDRDVAIELAIAAAEHDAHPAAADSSTTS